MGSKNSKLTGLATANAAKRNMNFPKILGQCTAVAANRRGMRGLKSLQMAMNNTAVTAIRIPTSVLAVLTLTIIWVNKDPKDWKIPKQHTAVTANRILMAVMTVHKTDFSQSKYRSDLPRRLKSSRAPLHLHTRNCQNNECDKVVNNYC